MKNIVYQINYKLPGGGDLSKYPVDSNIFIVSQKRIGFNDSILFVV